MSRVIQLAQEARFTIGRYHRLGEDYVCDSDGADITEELEAFYHAARAEMQNEIISKLKEYDASKCAQIAASVAA